MKYTNIKKLLIKFMGGEFINFPTRFLRWIKIDGDSDGDDDGGNDGGNDGNGNPICIPFVPGKVVGYLDNTDYDALLTRVGSWDGNKFSTISNDITGDIIIPEDLEQYILSHQGYLSFIPVLEYDETLDYNSPNYKDKSGLTMVEVYSGNGSYTIQGSTSGQCSKGTKDNEDYIVVIIPPEP